MKTCDFCKAENKDTSTYCRECGKALDEPTSSRAEPDGPRAAPEEPTGRRSGKSLVIVAVIVVAVLAAGGITAAVLLSGRKGTGEKALERAAELLEEATGTRPAGDTEGNNKSGKEVPSSRYRVGETIDMSGLELTVCSWEFSKGEGIQKPGTGDRFLVVDIKVANHTGEPVKVSSMLQMSIVSDDGDSFDVGFYYPQPRYPDGTVEPGETASGKVSFEVPAGLKSFYFVFDRDVMKAGEEAGVMLE